MAELNKIKAEKARDEAEKEAGRREEGGGGGSGWHPLTSTGFTRDRQDIQEGPG